MSASPSGSSPEAVVLNRLYTADTNALLSYLADTLPPDTDTAFRQAERGTATIAAPDVMFGEVLYRLSGGTVVNDIAVELQPQRAWRALAVDGPVSVASLDRAGVRELSTLVGEFNLHDAMLVASHIADSTDAIITRDPDIADVRSVSTIWD